MKKIDEMTVSELKEMAKSLSIKGYAKFNKEQLKEKLELFYNPNPDETTKKSTKVAAKKSESKVAKEEKKSTEEETKVTKKTTKKATKKKEENVEAEVTELPLGVKDIAELKSDRSANGILEIVEAGFGFIRDENYMPWANDVYVGKNFIKMYNLRTGDMITGPIRKKSDAIKEKFEALLSVETVNGLKPVEGAERPLFEKLTPIFPKEKINLDYVGAKPSMRIVDLVSPIGKGQRGMIVSPPKAGKTTLIKDIAKSIRVNHPEIKLIILLIDERPEEVTDIKSTINDPNVDINFSTFDEYPEHHKRMAEMVMHRAKRIAESGRDVVILLDSITRLARAYNLTITPSGRTLSGGLDPSALYGPKKFFGAARNLEEGGSLTILATALVETGSRMDDVIFEEFKGTGNMELVLDRKLSEKRIFPAIDVLKSGTRRDDLLLTDEERAIMDNVRKITAQVKPEDQSELIIKKFKETKSKDNFLNYFSKVKSLGGLYS